MGKKKNTSSVTAAPCHLPLKGKAGGRCIEVSHPAHGTYTAEGVKDKVQAVQRAAKAWGVQWSVLAKESTFREVSGTPAKPSEVVSMGEGRAPERVRPRAGAGAKDVEVARTS